MNNNPILIDVQGFFHREEAERQGFQYNTL